MRIEIAGMSREVCENCGRVSVGYVEEHYTEQGAQAALTKPDWSGSEG